MQQVVAIMFHAFINIFKFLSSPNLIVTVLVLSDVTKMELNNFADRYAKLQEWVTETFNMLN